MAIIQKVVQHAKLIQNGAAKQTIKIQTGRKANVSKYLYHHLRMIQPETTVKNAGDIISVYLVVVQRILQEILHSYVERIVMMSSRIGSTLLPSKMGAGKVSLM